MTEVKGILPSAKSAKFFEKKPKEFDTYNKVRENGSKIIFLRILIKSIA